VDRYFTRIANHVSWAKHGAEQGKESRAATMMTKGSVEAAVNG